MLKIRHISLALLTIMALLFAPVASAQSSLDLLRSRYAKVKSVQFKSVGNVTMLPEAGGPPARGQVHLEYSANANGYSLKCSSDPSLNLVGDMEVAYDGGSWQLLLNDEVPVLALRNAIAKRRNPTACPNPFFMMVQFLGEHEAGCGYTCTDLADLSDRGGTVQMERAIAGSDEYTLDGRGVGELSRRYVVTLDRKTGEPLKLIRLYPSGRRESELIVRNTSPTPVGPLPTEIVVSAYNDDELGRQTQSATFAISELAINKPVDETLFTIDWSRAQVVRNADTGEYLRHSFGQLSK